MELGQILMMAAVPAGIGAYYWWTVGRRGGPAAYMRRRLGLRDGEETTGIWMAYYDIDRTTAEKVGEVFGVHTRGTNIMVALTNQQRLAIGSNEREVAPIVFDRGQVVISNFAKSAEIGSLAGPSGSLEPAQVLLLTPLHGTPPFRIQIGGSGARDLLRWSDASAAAPYGPTAG